MRATNRSQSIGLAKFNRFSPSFHLFLSSPFAWQLFLSWSICSHKWKVVTTLSHIIERYKLNADWTLDDDDDNDTEKKRKSRLHENPVRFFATKHLKIWGLLETIPWIWWNGFLKTGTEKMKKTRAQSVDIMVWNLTQTWALM